MGPNFHSLLSAHHLIGAYFLTTESDKCMRLITRLYGTTIRDTINEPQARYHQLLGNPDSDICDLLSNRPSFDLSEYQQSFAESQYRAFNRIGEGKQVQAAIIGPAGTGNFYLLQVLI